MDDQKQNTNGILLVFFAAFPPTIFLNGAMQRHGVAVDVRGIVCWAWALTWTSIASLLFQRGMAWRQRVNIASIWSGTAAVAVLITNLFDRVWAK